MELTVDPNRRQPVLAAKHTPEKAVIPRNRQARVG
jgi:hypothetical protein